MDFKTLTAEKIIDRDEWTDNFFDEMSKTEAAHVENTRDVIKKDEASEEELPTEKDVDVFGDSEDESKKNFGIFAILVILIVLISFLCGMFVQKIITKASHNSSYSATYENSSDV